MQQKGISWFLLILLSLVWGSSFILMKRGLLAFSSEEVAALRISIAFLFLSPLLFKSREFHPRKHLPGILIMGICGNLIPAFLFTKAQTSISSSLAGMLNALTPMFTLLVTYYWLKKKPSGRQMSGVIAGFLGALCLIFFAETDDVFRNFSYGGLVLLAAFLYAVSITGIKKYLSDLSSVTSTAYAFSITGPIALTILFGTTDFTAHLSGNAAAPASLGYISLLAIVGTAISVILYNVLIKKGGVMFASSTTYLIPVVAMGWGYIDGEKISTGQLFGMLVIILSVYLINKEDSGLVKSNKSKAR
jgi:drug/metabolite transporter (DMT)-like permease